MSPEVVLSRMLPAVETLLKAVVERVLTAETPPTLYDLEALTQRVLPQIGQVVVQELTSAQGCGVRRGRVGVAASSSTTTKPGGWWCRPVSGTAGWTGGRTTGVRDVGRPAIRSTSSEGWGRPSG